jgi:DNA-binding transcriptional ArsR family regulator
MRPESIRKSIPPSPRNILFLKHKKSMHQRCAQNQPALAGKFNPAFIFNHMVEDTNPTSQRPQNPAKSSDMPEQCVTQHRTLNQPVDRSRRPVYATPMTAKLDLAFSALADPTRRTILTMLLEDDMAVTDVAEPFQMSLAAISKHLTILARAGLISQEKRGRVKWCKLEPAALKDASLWMESFGQFEAVNLDAFERFLIQELPGTP